MRLRPIFDTNIFGHVQDGSISERDWRSLLRRLPRGCPLSSVTAMELLVGVDNVPFAHLKEQIELACRLSNGRVVEDPQVLLCKEVLHLAFPPDVVAPAAKILARYLAVALRAKTRAEIVEGGVRYKRVLTDHAGFDPSVVKCLASGPKRAWRDGVESLASEIYPRWREHLQETGKRLPDELRARLKLASVWNAERERFIESKLRWLHASTDPESVAETTKRLDAVLEFTTYVTREFLTRNYKLENHDSDVYDQFQLHYLAMDRFVIVSEDRDFRKRTACSTQAERIMSFKQFLDTL